LSDEDQPNVSETVQGTSDAGMTAEQLAEAKSYGRYDLACALADKAVDITFLGIAALVLAVPIDGWLKQWQLLADYRWLRLVAMCLVVLGLHVCVSFPLSFYSGHVLERRFGLSKQSFGRWLADYVKTMGLTAVFEPLMLLGLYWIIWEIGPYWWLPAATAAFVVSIALGQLYPVLIMPLFRKCQRLDDPQLAQRMKRLAEGTGMSIEGVYRRVVSQDTVKLGASLAGLGRTRRVHLDDTLLEQLTPEEIEVVLAHEIGHKVYHHLHKMLAAGVVYMAAGFWICDQLLAGWVARVEQIEAGAVSYAELPIYTVPLVMWIMLLFSTLLGPLQNAVSRHYERQSDAYALRRTGNRAAYVSAFRKLAKLNKDDPNPHPLDVIFFHGHPPIAKRLAMAELPNEPLPANRQTQ